MALRRWTLDRARLLLGLPPSESSAEQDKTEMSFSQTLEEVRSHVAVFKTSKVAPGIPLWGDVFDYSPDAQGKPGNLIRL